jgi:diguanylate cyclase (GGDEF)-like protein
MTWSAEAILDAIPDASAVLDADGVIVAVNRAWQLFGAENGADPVSVGVGVSYLDVCRRAAADGCADADEVLARLDSVLRGSAAESDLPYPCPSTGIDRWFLFRATLIEGPGPHLLIGHVDITRQKQAEQALTRRVSQDPLTGLASRSAFHERLAEAMTARPGRGGVPDVGLIYIDLDDFKLINDTYGHAAGDVVLQTVGERLRRRTRPQDTAGRLGGDEFAVLAPRITPVGLRRLAERIGTSLAGQLLVQGRPIRLGASLGTYLGRPGDDPVECLRQADLAMYAAKTSARLAATGADRAPGPAPAAVDDAC